MFIQDFDRWLEVTADQVGKQIMRGVEKLFKKLSKEGDDNGS